MSERVSRLVDDGLQGNDELLDMFPQVNNIYALAVHSLEQFEKEMGVSLDSFDLDYTITVKEYTWDAKVVFEFTGTDDEMSFSVTWNDVSTQSWFRAVLYNKQGAVKAFIDIETSHENTMGFCHKEELTIALTDISEKQQELDLV